MALSVGLVGALWLLTLATIERTSRAAAERAVDVDLAGLVDIYASGGEDELGRRIADRLVLRSSEGSDLASWPRLDARLSEAGRVTLPNGAEAQARATQLGPDLRLIVMREQGDTDTLLWRVGLVFLASGAGLLIAVGLLGRMAALRLARRIERINRAFRDPPEEQHETLPTCQADD